VRLVLPCVTACFECSIDMFPPPTTFQLCTIAETPRKPEHCVAYAMIKLWDAAFPGRKIDNDSPDDMKWLYEHAAERAATYGIEGVTYALTLGVVKNIIPAIASTNALIAAASVVEAWKLITFAAQSLNSYFMYMGQEGLYATVQALERKPDCGACGRVSQVVRLPAAATLRDLLRHLATEPAFQLDKPSLMAPGRPLYVQNPPALRAATQGNLDLPLRALLEEGQEVAVTDPVYPAGHSLSIVVRLAD